MNLKTKILIGLLFVAFGANAQRKITLNEAQQLAIDNAKILKVDNAKRDISLSKIEQLRASTKYPTVNLSAAYNRLSNNVDAFKIVIPGGPPEGVTVQPIILNQFQNRLNISQLLYGGDRTKNTLKLLELQIQSNGMETMKDIEDVKFNITQIYYTLYKLNVAKNLIAENISLIDDNIRDIENAKNQGIALENDVLRLKLQKSNIELSRIDAENAIESTTFNFNLMTGLALETAILTDSASIFQNKSFLSLNEYIGEAQKNRHDLKAIALRKEAALTQIDITKAGLKPTLSAGATYFLDNPNQRVFPQQDTFRGTWALGLTAAYSISSLWNIKHQVAENQANVFLIDGTYEQASDGIKMEINQNYSAVKQAKEKIKVAIITVEQANENYRVTNNRYKEGLVTLTDLVNANFLVLQSKMSLLNTQTDSELAYQRLMKSVNN